MITVAHSVEEHLLTAETIAVIEIRLVCQSVQCSKYSLSIITVYKITCKSAAVLHELEIIQLLKRIDTRFKRLYHCLFHIIDKYHDMRKLQCRITAYLHSRRDAGGYSCFSSAHLRGAALVVVILLKIDSAHKACTNLAVCLSADGKYQGILVLIEDTLCKILLHGGVDSSDTLLSVRCLKIDLRQNELQGRCRIACYLSCLFPVCRLAGVLIAGYYRPLCHFLRTELREEDICCGESCHDNISFLFFPKNHIYILSHNSALFNSSAIKNTGRSRCPYQNTYFSFRCTRKAQRQRLSPCPCR